MNNNAVPNTNSESTPIPIATPTPTGPPRATSAMQKNVSPVGLLVPLLLIVAIVGGYFLWQNFQRPPSENMTTAELSAKIKKGQTLAEVQTMAGAETQEMTIDTPGIGPQSLYRYRTRDGNVFIAVNLSRDAKSARVQSVKTKLLTAAQRNGER